ncbi:MAG: hypothetical protein K5985_11965 [Lachnospiraceae bacterium]|nr:hypothetical protein [Lachnospiraceae bacterium]
MKKFGRFLFFLLLAGGAALGTWWYLKSKDDAGDFEDFDDEEDDELDAFLKEESEAAGKDREYVPLNLAEEAKETVTEDVSETAEKAATGAGKIIGDAKKAAAEGANVVKEAAEDAVSEFKFESLNN